MRTLRLALEGRGYPIHIGDGLLARGELYAPHIRRRRLLVVSNQRILSLYQTQLQSAIGEFESVLIPDGEGAKVLTTLEQIVRQLLERRYGRDSVLLALGGGVVGDITGFTAACYQRGIAFIQLPTTLLAQVDAAIGGKTGVNHPLGKNMIGAFHQPLAVIADTSTLHTLPEREYRAGLAEVIKYGLIRDVGFVDQLEATMAALGARQPQAIAAAVERSCRNKLEVVMEDEREQGTRALLNLGHSFAHAMENAQNYRGLLHGEAVAVGICMAARLSADMQLLSGVAVERIHRLIEAAGLPCTVPAGLSAARLRECMAVDKKASVGVLRLVLLEDIGRAVVVQDVHETLLMDCLRACGAS